jgi:hypothetical protein
MESDGLIYIHVIPCHCYGNSNIDGWLMEFENDGEIM